MELKKNPYSIAILPIFSHFFYSHLSEIRNHIRIYFWVSNLIFSAYFAHVNILDSIVPLISVKRTWYSYAARLIDITEPFQPPRLHHQLWRKQTYLTAANITLLSLNIIIFNFQKKIREAFANCPRTLQRTFFLRSFYWK